MEYVFSWIIFSFVAGAVGSGRKVGYWGAFFLSLFLSPIVGLIIAFASERKSDAALKESLINNQAKAAPTKSVAQQLFEAKSLLDSGAITQYEYEKMKSNILNS